MPTDPSGECRLNEPELRRRLGDGLRRKVEREYAADCVAGRWEGLIDEVVAEAEGREARAGTRSDGGRLAGRTTRAETRSRKPMADQDRYREDRDDDDRRNRGGERGGDPYRGGEGPPGPGRVSPPGGGYERQGGYDQGGREDRGGRQRGDPRSEREDNRGDPRGGGPGDHRRGDPRGPGGAGRERGDYSPRVNEDIGQGAYGQGFVGNQGRGYGGGAERDNSRNAQASDPNPEDRQWWERATDQVATWFGDEGAEQRREADREADHRGRTSGA